MESHSEVKTADNGAQVEIGTVSHNGKDYSALGSIIDKERGVIVGYVGRDSASGVLSLQTWSGQKISGLREVGKWTQQRISSRGWYYKIDLRAYRTTIDGYVWHGRGAGEGMILRLHRGKKVR